MERICFLYVNVLFCLFKLVDGLSETVYEGDSLPQHGRCEPITIQFCQQLIYNQTIFPNFLNHAKQEDAGLDFHKYTPLVKVNCSPDQSIEDNVTRNLYILRYKNI